MSTLTLDDVSVRLGDRDTLAGVTLTVPAGSLVAVLGPSGCGKTTLLRAIAGVLPLTGGSIRMDGRELSTASRRVPPERRRVGWVPQDASLFPHLTVGQNIGFGLRRSPARARRVQELARLVGLTDLVDRSPASLSGGQAQRVALARALAVRPEVVLLDEPFAALDAQLRVSLRREVADLLRATGTTSVLVTHDQEEALSTADYVAVMRNGRLVQWGTPREVYEQPADPWTASFVGDIVEVEGHWSSGRLQTPLGLVAARAVDGEAAAGPVRALLRPEWLTLSGADGVEATVDGISYAGHDALVALRLPSGTCVQSRVAAPDVPDVGSRVCVGIRGCALAFAVADAGRTPGNTTEPAVLNPA